MTTLRLCPPEQGVTASGTRYTSEALKKGNRLYGYLMTYADGRRIYLARRKLSQIYRAGRPTISDAVRDGVAAWAIDDETLLLLKAKMVRFVGVRVIGHSDQVWIAPIERFFETGPAKKWSFHNYERKGGSRQRLLPLQHFRSTGGIVPVHASALAA